MKITLKLFLCLIFCSAIFFNTAQAQFTLKFTEQHRLLKQGIEHYEYGHYQKSGDLLKQYLDKELIKTERSPLGTHASLDHATATFYNLLTEVGLKKDGAMADLGLFLAETPFAALQQYGYFKMAKFLFKQQSFVQAIPFYEKSNINYLSNEEITQRNFELAYCYLINNQLDKVKPLFASVKDVEGDYFSPGNYYHGVLSYYRGDYTSALRSFEAVKNQSQYKDIVPFYIAEINYFKGDKEKALQQALNYSRNKNDAYTTAMNQLAGQIYYDRGDFAKAEKYIGQYADQDDNVRNEDYFRMGYIKYQKGELADAISYFKKTKNNGSDIFAQSLYYLGLSYLKNGNKKNALSVFRSGLKTKKLGKLHEDVQFNVAKLSNDLADDKNTVNELSSFISQYPNSKYYNSAIEMLALINIKSKNFEEASKALQKLRNLSPAFQNVYQKVNYARGIQLLKNGNSNLAIPFFVESKKYPVNENLVGLAEFWKTECHYRLGQYRKALASSNRFIDNPGSGNSPALIRNSFLTNAYIYMHTNDKEELKLAYSKYLDTSLVISTAEALGDMDSMKPNYVPSHVPYVEANPYVFIYQLPSQKVDFSYKPLPLTPIAYNNLGKGSVAKKNYIKLGYGNLRTSHAELGYDFSEDFNNDMYLTLSHRASNSNNNLQQASQNQLRLISNNRTLSFDIQSALQIERNVYRPFGAIDHFVRSDTRNRFLDINLLSKIIPKIELIKGIETDATVGLAVYNINSVGGSWSGSELSFVADVPFSKIINDKTTAKLGVEAQVNQLVGGSAKPDNINKGSSFLVLKPSLIKQINDIKLEVGLYPALAQNFHLLPNASAKTYLASINANVGVGVESNIIANSYKQLTQVNPFLQFVDLKQTKRTLYYGKIAGAIYNNFNYAFKVGGGKIKNLPLYLNNYFTNRSFDVLYEKDATILSLQANVEYQINFKTNAGVQFQFEPLLSEVDILSQAYHYVPLVANAFARYTLLDRLNLRGDLFYQTGSMARTTVGTERLDQRLSSVADLNLRADYQLGKNWNVFLELNNLLNSKYQRWYNYPNYGLNVLGGFVYSFDKSLRAKKD